MPFEYSRVTGSSAMPLPISAAAERAKKPKDTETTVVKLMVTGIVIPPVQLILCGSAANSIGHYHPCRQELPKPVLLHRSVSRYVQRNQSSNRFYPLYSMPPQPRWLGYRS